MKLGFSPRPSQRLILRYSGGRLGIAAVPGSGKTHTLSALAAQLIASGQLASKQEVLIVTLVNSAVDNFSSRIAALSPTGSLLPHLGYRVRTLHGLAHDIVREDPPLVGLDQQFSIVDEIGSIAMIRSAARDWVHAHPEVGARYLAESLGDQQRRKIERKEWPDLVEGVAASFIRAAKNGQWTPDNLRLAADRQTTRLPLLDLGIDIYAEYQRALSYRGSVDFDDLVRLAAAMLDASPELLDRLRRRWPFILEDEAQDSSEIQQRIISTLVGTPGNWVRVGDPNQAIFETFTTADPKLLLDFIANNPHVDMPESGRCQPSIMRLANFLIDWVGTRHPSVEIRNALVPPSICPVPADDPQPNPPDDPAGVRLLASRLTPEQELDDVANSVAEWLPNHQDQTVAVLASTNAHAARMVAALRHRNIAHRELLRSTAPTRAAVGALSYILSYLSAPESASRLAQAYRVWRRDRREDSSRQELFGRVVRILARLKRLEDYLSPGALAPSLDLLARGAPPEKDLEAERPAEDVAAIVKELSSFRRVVTLWQGATALPIDQLVLTIGRDIFAAPADLALAHKLALLMRQMAAENPHWRLPDLVPGLQEIARNERRLIGFSSDDAGFNPQAYKGVVVVATMHKAKGLEWDRVYLMAVNSYDYPSAQPADQFISEKWFLHDRLNLEAETLRQLETATSGDRSPEYLEGDATRAARLDYARERLRLLYVGITRARRELIITCNTGRRGEAEPALPLEAMRSWWEAAAH